MITTKTINNQNAVINAILGTDNNSTTTINGNLLIQDSIGNSLTITPTGTLPQTNPTFNNITVNGTSNFNQLALMHLGGRVYSGSFMVNGTDFRIADSTGSNGMQAFYSGGFVSFQGIAINSGMNF